MKTKKLCFLLATLIICSCGGESKKPAGNNSSISNIVVSSSTPIQNSSSNIISSSSTIISSSSQSSSYVSSSNNGTDQEKFLDTPSLVIDELTNVVSWNEVEGATHYNYIINGEEILTTTSLTLALEDKTNVSVQAANDELTSLWSQAATAYDTSDVIVEKQEYIQVYFHDAPYSPLTIKAGESISKPSDPIKNNNVFDNWYKDPYHKELFDFGNPIYESTIIYANYIPSDLIKDTYFWIKGSPKMSASVMSDSSNSGWHFIPLKLNKEQTKYREFIATVTVSGATATSPCQFLIMDGFDDNSGRRYWKNGDSDFTISSNGTFNIYFSVETQYMLNGNVVHAKYLPANNTSSQNVSYASKLQLETPLVSVDSVNNVARWETINGATGYEVVIDNGVSQLINTNYISLPKKSHISVRAVGSNNICSKWSLPNANINYIVNEEKPTHAYVYFNESNLNSEKYEVGTYVNEIQLENKENYKFEGWYLDIALTKPAVFPYLVEENVVFYPKWTYQVSDFATKAYYKLVDSSNNVISMLTWNIDNYSFYEYETSQVELVEGNTYYIKTLDDSKTWGPYTSSTGKYVIYFSEDYKWNVNTEKESNIYLSPQAINVYFSNALHWSEPIYAYIFNKSSGEYDHAWPGEPMTYVKTNSMGQKIYTIEVDTSAYDYIIFSGGGSQTVDIPLSGAVNGSGFYSKSEKEGSNYKYGTYTFA